MPHQIYFLFFGFCAKNVVQSEQNVNFFSFCLLVIFDERNVKYYAKNIFLIFFHVFSEARDHILILNILFFNKLRQIIPEVRSEIRDLLIFIFILKTTGHSHRFTQQGT